MTPEQGALIILTMGAVFMILGLMAAPGYYCEKWGGQLYDNGRCYDLDNMELCIDPQGSLRSKAQSFIIPKNITFMEDPHK